MDAQWLITHVGSPLLELLLPLLAAAIAGLVLMLLKRALQRLGIQLSEDQEDQIRRKVQEVILQIEETKRQQVKRGELPLNPRDALNVAVDKLTPQLPKLDRDEIVAKIHTELPRVRARLHGGINPGLPGGGRR